MRRDEPHSQLGEMSFHGERMHCFGTQNYKTKNRSIQGKDRCSQKLLSPMSVKGIRSFFRTCLIFIKDFSKIFKPLCKLMEKDSVFNFDGDCLTTFEEFKKRLI
ncbi:Retrovirus-related Pol polyprotein from transposon opus [Gossypium australe]|uniref:Retrovirus-related Pol polyprotein from transposon opus n=1 Tax=Gossypium australe TaxID=47621 RepID=A0A5B6V9A5_9ROSI|nr:Retrovirus-related Pol polyprotein from transposon opus [Gossypium australe]